MPERPLFWHWVAPENYRNGVSGAVAFVFTYYRCRFDGLGDVSAGTDVGAIVFDASMTATAGGIAGTDINVGISRFVRP